MVSSGKRTSWAPAFLAFSAQAKTFFAFPVISPTTGFICAIAILNFRMGRRLSEGGRGVKGRENNFWCLDVLQEAILFMLSTKYHVTRLSPLFVTGLPSLLSSPPPQSPPRRRLP